MGKIIKNGIVYGGGGGGSGSGHTIMDTNGNFMPAENNLQFIGLDVTDNSSDGITEVESATLNQDSLDDIMSAGAAGNQVAGNGLVYSTNEQIIGRWIDGKPLYQKVVVVGTVAAPSASEVTFNHGIANIDKLVCTPVGFAISDSDGGIYPLPYFATSGSVALFIRRVTRTQIVYMNNSGWTGFTFYVILRYTKTS